MNPIEEPVKDVIPLKVKSLMNELMKALTEFSALEAYEEMRMTQEISRERQMLREIFGEPNIVAPPFLPFDNFMIIRELPFGGKSMKH